MLTHEEQEVYQVSLRFVAMTARINSSLPHHDTALADQLRRTALSIPIFIAEALAESSHVEQRAVLTDARSAAMECGALLDVLAMLGVAEPADMKEAKRLLEKTTVLLAQKLGSV